MAELDIQKLQSSISSLSERVEKLEKQVFNLQPAPAVRPASLEEKTPQALTVEEGKLKTRPEEVFVVSDSYRASNKEENSGGKLLAWVAIIFFFTAASLFIRLAIDSGWLTPERQFAILLLFSLGLSGSGIFLYKKDAPYSSFLTGAGVAMAYFAVYAGHLYFHLYAEIAALVSVAFITAGSIYLFRHFSHDYFIIVAAAGCYFAPLLIGGQNISLTIVSGYFVIWDLVFCSMAFIAKRRHLVAYSSYFAILIFQVMVEINYVHSSYSLGMIIQALQILIFSISVALYTVRTKIVMTSAEAWSYFPVLLLFYVCEYAMVSSAYADIAPWISLLFAAFLIRLYIFSRRSAALSFNSGPMVTTYCAIIFVHALYLELLPIIYAPVFGLLALLAIPIISRREEEGSSYWLTNFILGSIGIFEYLRVFNNSSHFSDAYVLLLSIAFAALLLFFYLNVRKNKDGASWLLIMAIPQAMLALGTVSEFLSAEYSEYITSGLWASLALVLLLAALSFRDRVMANFAVMVFLFVAAKVMFGDLASQGPLVKIVTLLFVGALIYAGGYFVRKLNAKE